MIATIFFTLPHGIYSNDPLYLTASGVSAGECLDSLEKQLKSEYQFWTVLTYRPMDGMIFSGEVSTLTPIGVLYREGYPI
jgi:hypothetical protein